jgi:hypothetical protein
MPPGATAFCRNVGEPKPVPPRNVRGCACVTVNSASTQTIARIEEIPVYRFGATKSIRAAEILTCCYGLTGHQPKKSKLYLPPRQPLVTNHHLHPPVTMFP